jgi:Dna[CI] antecedent DciA-like protein
MAGEQPATLEELRRLSKHKSSTIKTASLGPEMVEFFKHSVAKRQGKLLQLAESWSRLVPQTLSEHCALDSFHRGALVVLVDSSAHLYEMKQLLLAGLQDQLLLACSAAGLRKITLRPGRWYDGDPTSHPADRRVRF